jgi:hypothetical protein
MGGITRMINMGLLDEPLGPGDEHSVPLRVPFVLSTTFAAYFGGGFGPGGGLGVLGVSRPHRRNQSGAALRGRRI